MMVREEVQEGILCMLAGLGSCRLALWGADDRRKEKRKMRSNMGGGSVYSRTPRENNGNCWKSMNVKVAAELSQMNRMRLV